MTKFDFNKTADCAEMIKYCSENWLVLRSKFAESDWHALQSALDVIKLSTISKIVECQATDSQEVLRQIEEAKSVLQAKIDSLEKEIKAIPTDYTYEPYTPTETDKKVITSFKNVVEESQRRQYETAKESDVQEKKTNAEREIRKLTEELEKLQQIGEKIDDPKEFIKEIVKSHLAIKGYSYTKAYQELIDRCAMNMAYGYCDMESSRMPVEKDGKVFWDLPIFSSTKTFASSSGYRINPEALKVFLDLIRDEDLCKELGAYDKKLEALLTSQQTQEVVMTQLSKVEEKQALLDDKELCKQVEATISHICELSNQRSEIYDQISQTNVPAKTNPVSRFLAWVTGSQKKAEQKKEELEKKKSSIGAQISKAYEDYKNKAIEDPRFGKLILLYEEAYQPENASQRTIALPLISSIEFEGHFKDFDKRSESMIGPDKKYQSKSAFVRSALKLDEKHEKLKSRNDQISSEIQEKETVERKAYEGLSPKIKELLEAAPNHRVPMSGIIGRYIEPSGQNSRYGISPFIASLVLEALFNMGNIKTAEDAQKYGINLDMSKIESDVGVINERIKQFLEQHITKQDQEAEL